MAARPRLRQLFKALAMIRIHQHLLYPYAPNRKRYKKYRRAIRTRVDLRRGYKRESLFTKARRMIIQGKKFM